MSDLIERQAAINAVSRGCQEFRGIFAECEKNLNELPSAQPKLKLVDITDISEIFEPKFTEEEIQMMQELEAAEIEKRHISLAWKTHSVAKDINVPINDTISRQAAIDACIRVREYRAYDEIEEIKALPSAQPELILCKDCKHCATETDKDGNTCYSCTLIYDECTFWQDVEPTDFCSWAERRTDA